MRQVLKAGALGRPRGMEWGGRWEGGSGWGTHVNTWLIHVSVWQTPQYCKLISLQLIKITEKEIASHSSTLTWKIPWTKEPGRLSHHFMANRWGNYGNSDRLYFLEFENHCRS